MADLCVLKVAGLPRLWLTGRHRQNDPPGFVLCQAVIALTKRHAVTVGVGWDSDLPWRPWPNWYQRFYQKRVPHWYYCAAWCGVFVAFGVVPAGGTP